MCAEQYVCGADNLSNMPSGWSATFLTIISGVLVFVIGQLFNEYWLKPIQDYKRLRAQISYSLCYYGNLYMNPIKIQDDVDGKWNEGSQKMRELSAEVRATVELRPFGNIFIPGKKKLSVVAQNIMGISNGFFVIQNHDYITDNENYCKEIYKLLKIQGEK
ncbi:MAG: hypothetical protein E7406_04345 [Ruminococcaceae bacterium]|nr:hypothetical protein [Oscillospiraceae bacterium]